jgi:enoyl-CoA hydratase
MYRELRSFFGDLPSTDNIKVVILTARGKHFCAGNDLEEFETLDPVNGVARMKEVREAFSAIRHCQLPVIAAIDGVAFGTGVAIAASCDLVVASEAAKFSLPELSVGVMGGARHLARLVPPSMVRKMFFTAQPVSANEIYKLGGIARLVPSPSLIEEAKDLALLIARHSRISLEVGKIGLNEIESLEVEEGYIREQELTCWVCGFRDSKEALHSVIERRSAIYSNETPDGGTLAALKASLVRANFELD